VEDDGYANERWWNEGGFENGKEPGRWGIQTEHPNRPVVNVSWYEAAAYCAWKGARLPREAEWEQAAGEGQRAYPWGDERPDANRANFNEMGPKHPTPVGLYPAGATPEGLQDMAGNVWEWCADRHVAAGLRAVRGGSCQDNDSYLRAGRRYKFQRAEVGFDDFGFRLARDRFT